MFLIVLDCINIVIYSTKGILSTKAAYKFAKDFGAEKYLEEYDESLLHGKAVSYVTPDFSNCPKIKPYFDKLAQHLTIDELSTATNNIKNLKFRRGIFSLTCAGTYSVKKNLLTYYSKSAIGHELLHMASAYYDKEHKLDLCGFHIYKNKKSIGRGLNEGYTELLASRIFNKDGKVTAYKNLASICEMLELLFNKPEDMRRMYFNNDFTGFIKQLENYMTKEEAFNLVFEMDKYSFDISKSRALAIENFIYRRFMERCYNQEKREKMEQLVSTKNKRDCKAIKGKNSVSQIEKRTNKQYIFSAVRRTCATSAAMVCLYSALLVNNTASWNQTRFNNKISQIINNEVVEYGSYRTMSFNENQVESMVSYNYDSEDIYQYLVSQKVNYCKILGDYYTNDGGNITIQIFDACLFVNDENGGHMVDDVVTSVILPDGRRFSDCKDISSLRALNLVSEETYYSKPFSDILELDLNNVVMPVQMANKKN